MAKRSACSKTLRALALRLRADGDRLAGAERLSGKPERTEAEELRRQIMRLERALGRKTMEVEIAGELLRGWE